MELKDLMKRKMGRATDWAWKKKVYKELCKLYAYEGVSRVRANWSLVERVNNPKDALYKPNAPQTEQAIRRIYQDVDKALRDGIIKL